MSRPPVRCHRRATATAAVLIMLVACAPAAHAATPSVRLIARAGARVEAVIPAHMRTAAVRLEVDGRRRAIVDPPATFSVHGLRAASQDGWHRLRVRSRGAVATARFAVARRPDRRGPTLVLTRAPARRGAGTIAAFRYSASGGAISCAIDAAPVGCSRRSLRTTVTPGQHVFEVRARGRRGSSVLSWRWTAAAPAPGANGAPAAFGPVLMADGFERETRRWTAYGPRWPGNGGNGIRDQRALSVRGGVLTITARMVNGTLVSGAVASKLNITYGRVEFRVRTDPDPSGATSGVVLMWPQSNRWPIDGETDIYETGTDTDRRPFSSFVHFGADNQQVWIGHDADGTRWQAMAMEWTPSAIRFYRDGALVGEVTDPQAIPHVPQHLAIQLDAFSPTMTGTVRMQVDDVRILAYTG